MSSLPREAVFLHRRPKIEFITRPHRQPSKKNQFDLEALGDVDCKEDVLYHSGIKPKLEEFPRGLTSPLPVAPGRESKLPIVGGMSN